MSNPQIRLLKVSDFDAVMAIAKQFHRESSYSTIPFSSQRVLELLARCVENEDYLPVVLEEQGVIQGFFCGALQRFYFSESVGAVDMALFVSPEYRGRQNIRRLISKYIQWATSKGAVRVTVSQSSGINVEKTERFFSAIGLQKVGGVFIADCQ